MSGQDKYGCVNDGTMSRLLVCYEQDLPSFNMKEQLLKKLDWEDLGSDGTNTYLRNGDNVLMTIDRMHVHAENIDRKAEEFGIKVNDMVVLSRHSSASSKPTLTVHPIGNYRTNEMGGQAETLAFGFESLDDRSDMLVELTLLLFALANGNDGHMYWRQTRRQHKSIVIAVGHN